MSQKQGFLNLKTERKREGETEREGGRRSLELRFFSRFKRVATFFGKSNPFLAILNFSFELGLRDRGLERDLNSDLFFSEFRG